MDDLSSMQRKASERGILWQIRAGHFGLFWRMSMSRMRFVLGGMLAVALIGGGLLFGDDPKPKGQGRLPANWSKLGLSDDQKRQIYSIEGEYKTKIDDLQSQIDQLRKKERSEMSKVLTAAQKARLREIVAAKSGGGDDDTAPPKKKPGGDK
jgi:hypothetical protein